jgi:glycerol kinase
MYTETTALGAALAAGIGAKLWTSESVFEGTPLASSTFFPEKSDKETATDYKRWKNAVKTVINHSDRISQAD